MTKAKKIVSRCESCVNYVFDEDCECYCCMVDLDEDEAYRSMSDSEYNTRLNFSTIFLLSFLFLVEIKHNFL